MILTIIGGASGVGKTSLLKLFADIKQINTGDLFKKAMLLENRDEVKGGNWSILESDVADSIVEAISLCMKNGQNAIIDTHFAAKIYNKQYKIGLEEKHLFRFGEIVFRQCMVLDKAIYVNIVLVSANPFMLLNRRRLDKTRNRELVPSDCYNDLRCNDVYSYRYLSALQRAKTKSGVCDKLCDIKHFVVQNEAIETSQKKLIEIIRR